VDQQDAAQDAAQDARAQLEQMLRELDSATATLEAEGAGESEELTHLSQHPADTASEVSDADRENALQGRDDGTYGRCVDCGQQIPAARLEVRPEAARCIADQERFEAASA
jgi:DnaK suppressor protein